MVGKALQITQIPWWEVLLTGIAGLVFGVAAIFWPGMTVFVLALTFGAYMLVNGVINMVAAIQSRHSQGLWWLSLVLGVIELGVGVFLIRNPGVALATLVLILGFSLMASGILQLVPVFDKTTPTALKTLFVISGVLSFVAGAIILMYPEKGTLAFIWVLGLYAILTGVVRIALAFDIKADSEEAAA